MLEVRLRIGRGGGQPMETRGLVADWSAALGQLTIWASSQVPHQIRQFSGDLLGLGGRQVGPKCASFSGWDATRPGARRLLWLLAMTTAARPRNSYQRPPPEQASLY